MSKDMHTPLLDAPEPVRCRSGHPMSNAVTGKTNKPHCTVCLSKVPAKTSFYRCPCTTACATCAKGALKLSPSGSRLPSRGRSAQDDGSESEARSRSPQGLDTAATSSIIGIVPVVAQSTPSLVARARALSPRQRRSQADAEVEKSEPHDLSPSRVLSRTRALSPARMLSPVRALSPRRASTAVEEAAAARKRALGAESVAAKKVAAEEAASKKASAAEAAVRKRAAEAAKAKKAADAATAEAEAAAARAEAAADGDFTLSTEDAVGGTDASRRLHIVIQVKNTRKLFVRDSWVRATLLHCCCCCGCCGAAWVNRRVGSKVGERLAVALHEKHNIKSEVTVTATASECEVVLVLRHVPRVVQLVAKDWLKKKISEALERQGLDFELTTERRAV